MIYFGKITANELQYISGYTQLGQNVYGVAFNDYEDFIDGGTSTLTSFEGRRFGLAKGFEFEPSTTTYAGKDDFKTNNIAPFCPIECVTQYNSTTGKQEVVAYETDSNWNSVKNDTSYNRMVAFPKFYYRRNSEYQFAISPTKVTGCDTPSPMHYRNGKFYDYVYISKYHLNSNYMSVSGSEFVASTVLSTLRTNTRANGMYLMDYPAAMSLAMLMFIKYANLNVQSVIGLGLSAKSTVGGADAVLSKDGRVADEATDTGSTVVFGLEDYWGNAGTLIDGFFRNSSDTFYINTDIENITDDPDTSTFTGYTSISNTASTSSGYCQKLVYDSTYPYMMFPTTIIGSHAKSTSDYYTYYGSVSRCCMIGGYYNQGTKNGPLYLQAYAQLTSKLAYCGIRGMFFSTTYSSP